MPHRRPRSRGQVEGKQKHMTKGFKSVWGEKPAKRRDISVSTGGTDTESGNDGSGAEQALFALDAMFRRGLIPEDEYRRRRSEIEAGKVNPDD